MPNKTSKNSTQIFTQFRKYFYLLKNGKIKKGLVFSLTNEITNIGIRHNLLNNKQS